ncbi:MAG: hypothetical protein VB835_00065 [Pirellulales bacterium]
MAKELNVYRDWLGIEDVDQPTNHYQLLRLAKFDDDQERIRRHYRKLNGHVRKYSAGDYAEESQDLLNELARAMLCLTDVKRKAEYDKTLGRASAEDDRRQSLEKILVRNGTIDQEKLKRAKQYAEATGFALRDALVQQKLAPTETIVQAFAESVGLPYLDLSDIMIDESLFSKLSAVLARRHSVIPVMIENDQLLLASPNPLDLQLEEDLQLRLNISIRTVLCTPLDVNRVINEHYPREAADAELASHGAQPEEPREASSFEKLWNRLKKKGN